MKGLLQWLVTYLPWKTLQKDNILMKDFLQSDAGRPYGERDQGLIIKDGCFLVPKENIPVHDNVFFLPITMVDLLRYKKKEWCEAIERATNAVLKDSEDLMRYGKLAYFYALAYYVHTKQIKYSSIKELYESGVSRTIFYHFPEYVFGFDTLARKDTGVDSEKRFSYAKECIGLQMMSRDFENKNVFLRSNNYNIFSDRLGDIFQKEFENDILTSNKRYATYIAAILNQHYGRGVIVDIDGAGFLAQRVKIPDYVFVTTKYLYPVDVKKSALAIHNEKQVRADNLRQLFHEREDKMNILFDGIKIEGKLYKK